MFIYYNNIAVTYVPHFDVIHYENLILSMKYNEYYRQEYVILLCCLLKWHRFFMILTWSMTIAAFVIIFVELGEWSSEVIHASLGLATTILAFIQPFMAAARPHPGAPRRPLFNWAHWFVGNAAQICGSKLLFFFILHVFFVYFFSPRTID